MARNICPSCGSAYNGRKCRSCLYEHFTEEIAHGSHTHRGEPLVIDAPVRRPVKQKDPFGCEKKTRKKRPLAGLVVILAILNSLLPMIRNWGLELEARERAHIAPEPMPIPKDGQVLYEDSEIRIVARWRDGEDFVWDFPVYVENKSDRDISVTAEDIRINGYVMQYSYLYCEAAAGYTELGIFVFDEQDKVNAGILAVEEISFRLDITDTESYETIAQVSDITLRAKLPEGTLLNKELSGDTLFDRDGIRIQYLGYINGVSAYDPYDFGSGCLLFLLENSTDREVEISLDQGCVNDTMASLSAWCMLPAGAKAVRGIHAFPLESLGITSMEEVHSLTFQLLGWDYRTYDSLWDAQLLTVPNP